MGVIGDYLRPAGPHNADERAFDPVPEPVVVCMVLRALKGEGTQLRQIDFPAADGCGSGHAGVLDGRIPVGIFIGVPTGHLCHGTGDDL
jgi:hypothetical protein